MRCKKCASGFYPRYFLEDEVNLTDELNTTIKDKQKSYTAQNFNTKIEEDKAYYSMKFCIKRPLVDNCIEFDSGNSNKCTKCASDYYLDVPDGNEIGKLSLCKLRINKTYPNCQIIDHKSDSC